MPMDRQFRNQPAVIFRLYPFLCGDGSGGNLDIGGIRIVDRKDIPNQAAIFLNVGAQGGAGGIAFQNQRIAQLGCGIAADESASFIAAGKRNI